MQHQPPQHPLFLPVETGPSPHAWYQAARQQPSEPALEAGRRRLSLDHFQDLGQVLISPSSSSSFSSSWTCDLIRGDKSVVIREQMKEEWGVNVRTNDNLTQVLNNFSLQPQSTTQVFRNIFNCGQENRHLFFFSQHTDVLYAVHFLNRCRSNVYDQGTCNIKRFCVRFSYLFCLHLRCHCFYCCCCCCCCYCCYYCYCCCYRWALVTWRYHPAAVRPPACAPPQRFCWLLPPVSRREPRQVRPQSHLWCPPAQL